MTTTTHATATHATVTHESTRRCTLNTKFAFIVGIPRRCPIIPTRKSTLKNAPCRPGGRVPLKCMIGANNSWSSNDDVSTRLQSLRNELNEAINTQDFAKAASVRDAIRKLETSATDDVAIMLANDAFYDALRTCSVEKMMNIWMRNDGVSCTHPVSGLTSGFDDVIAGWQRVFTIARPKQAEVEIFALEAQRNLAWVICKQNVTCTRARDTFGGERIVTNLFQKEGGQWRLVHHHSSPVDIGNVDEENRDSTNDGRDGSESA